MEGALYNSHTAISVENHFLVSGHYKGILMTFMEPVQGDNLFVAFANECTVQEVASFHIDLNSMHCWRTEISLWLISTNCYVMLVVIRVFY